MLTWTTVVGDNRDEPQRHRLQHHRAAELPHAREAEHVGLGETLLQGIAGDEAGEPDTFSARLERQRPQPAELRAIPDDVPTTTCFAADERRGRFEQHVGPLQGPAVRRRPRAAVAPADAGWGGRTSRARHHSPGCRRPSRVPSRGSDRLWRASRPGWRPRGGVSRDSPAAAGRDRARKSASRAVDGSRRRTRPARGRPPFSGPRTKGTFAWRHQRAIGLWAVGVSGVSRCTRS